MATVTGSFKTDAVLANARFTVDAWVVGSSLRHDRTVQHQGTQPDTTVVLSEAIGRWPAGTDLHTFLADCCARVTALESATHYVSSFSINAFVLPAFRIDAVIYKSSGTMTFTLDAEKIHGGSFTMDARVSAIRSGSFTAAAYLIDNVC